MEDDGKMYNGKNFQVCVEKKNATSQAFVYSFLTYDFETFFDCMIFHNNQSTYTATVVKKHKWPLSIFYATSFFGLLFPVYFLLMVKVSPPISGSPYGFLAFDSDLPVGVKTLSLYQLAQLEMAYCHSYLYTAC